MLTWNLGRFDSPGKIEDKKCYKKDDNLENLECLTFKTIWIDLRLLSIS